MEATLSAYARGDNPDEIPVEAELWINDYRLPLPQKDVQKWAKDGRTRTLTVTVPDDQAAGRPQRRDLPDLEPAGRPDRRGRRRSPATSRPPVAPRLVGLAVGINDYGKPRAGQTEKGVLYNLDEAVNDAKAVASAWAGPKAVRPRWT